MVRYSKKPGKKGNVNRKNKSRKRGNKSGKSLRRSRLLKAERKRKRKSRKPKMRGGVLKIPTQLDLLKFIYGMYIYSELIKWENVNGPPLTELYNEKERTTDTVSIKRRTEINKQILSLGKPLENLNINYKAIKSLSEDAGNKTIMEKIIDRTLYVRAKSFKISNKKDTKIKALDNKKQVPKFAAGRELGEVVPAIPSGLIGQMGTAGVGGQKGGASSIPLDSGPAVAGHWPYMEVRHFINLCNNFIELESWLKRCQVPSFGKRKPVDSGPKSTLFAQAVPNMSEDDIADSILKTREEQRKEHYNQAPEDHSGRLAEIKEIKEGRSEVKNAIISSENIFKVIQSKVKAILMLTGLSTKAHDLTKTSALSFFSKKSSSSVVGNVKNIKQMLLPFTNKFTEKLSYKEYMYALYPEDSAQQKLPKPPPKKATVNYTNPDTVKIGLKPKLQSLVPFSGHPGSLYAKPIVSKDAVIRDWVIAVAEAEAEEAAAAEAEAAEAAAEAAKSEEERRTKNQEAIAAAEQDITDFIEEQRQIAYAKHMRPTKTKNIINSLTTAEMFTDFNIKEFLDGLNDLFFLDDEQTIQEIVINHYLEFDGAEAEVLQNTVISAAEAAVTAAVSAAEAAVPASPPVPTPRPRPVPRPRPRPAASSPDVHTFSNGGLAVEVATALKQSPGFISFLHDDSTHGAEINDLDYGFRDVQIEIPANAKTALPKQSHIALMRHNLSSSYLPDGQELKIGEEVVVKSWDSDFAVLEKSGVSIPTSHLDIMHPVGLLDCDWDV
jgi:hypothetical protein